MDEAPILTILPSAFNSKCEPASASRSASTVLLVRSAERIYKSSREAANCAASTRGCGERSAFLPASSKVPSIEVRMSAPDKAVSGCGRHWQTDVMTLVKTYREVYDEKAINCARSVHVLALTIRIGLLTSIACSCLIQYSRSASRCLFSLLLPDRPAEAISLSSQARSWRLERIDSRSGLCSGLATRMLSMIDRSVQTARRKRSNVISSTYMSNQLFGTSTPSMIRTDHIAIARPYLTEGDVQPWDKVVDLELPDEIFIFQSEKYIYRAC